VQWITANGVGPAVVNISFRPGACGADTSSLPVNASAVTSMATRNFTYTLSAGGGGACGPVTIVWSRDVLDKALVVAATDIQNNQDIAIASGYGPRLTLFAPGANITAAAPGSPYHSTDSGDSYAAPHVAGVAAAFLQEHKRATAAQVRTAILEGAAHDKVTNPGTSPNLLLQMVRGNNFRE
jgi:subtilisin family serine protease